MRPTGSSDVTVVEAGHVDEAGIVQRQSADVDDGELGAARRRLELAVPGRVRSAARYFPEANILVLVGSAADQSNTPTSKSIRITLQPSC